MNRTTRVVLSGLSLVALAAMAAACSGAADPGTTGESSQAVTSCLPGGPNPSSVRGFHAETCVIPPPTPTPKPLAGECTAPDTGTAGLAFPWMLPTCTPGLRGNWVATLTPAEQAAGANLVAELTEIGCSGEVFYTPPVSLGQTTYPWATMSCPSAGLSTLESAGGWTVQDGTLVAPSPLIGSVVTGDICTGAPFPGYVIVSYLAGGPECTPQGQPGPGCTSLACRVQ